MARRSARDTGLLLIMLVTGLLLGSLIGKAFSNLIPYIGMGESIGFSPVTIDLGFIVFTIGLSVSINVAGVIGLIIAFLIYKKM